MSTVEDLTATVRRFAEEREWEPFHTPKNLAMALSGEVGELVSQLQWLTADESSSIMERPAEAARVRAEIGDVMIYLVRLCDVLGIDPVAAAQEKLAEAGSRYTVEVARGSAAKVPVNTPDEL